MIYSDAEDLIIYAERIHGCTVLGPYKRSVIWVSGCCFDCEGCIAQNFRHREGNVTTVKEMGEWLIGAKGVEGITLSGGEPFLQAGPLSRMLSYVKKERDFGVIVYSGFTYRQLLERAASNPETGEFLKMADILIDGQYRKDLDDNRPYVGSSNQKIILLTDRYMDCWQQYYLEKKGRDVEIILSDGRTLLVGVPSKDQEQFWKDLNQQYL